MRKTTEELLNILNQSKDIKEYLNHQQENFTEGTLSEHLAGLMAEKSVSPGECIRRSGLDRTYCYQIFSGAKKPSRDKLLALCIALELTAEEVQRLLKSAGYPILYPRVRRDSIILFAIERGYTVMEVNEFLHDMDFALLE